MIIEFIGLTGVGKSTTMNELREALSGADIICSQGFNVDQFGGLTWKNLKLKYLSIQWIGQTLSLVFYLIYISIFVSKQVYWRKKRYFRKILHFWVEYRIYDSCKETGKFLLVDEGLFNGLSSLIHTDIISDRCLTKVCDILSSYFKKDNLLVYFVATENVSCERIRERKGTTRFDLIKDNNILLEQLSKKRILFEREIKCLSGKVEMLYLEDEATVDEKREMILKELNEHRWYKEKTYDCEE